MHPKSNRKSTFISKDRNVKICPGQSCILLVCNTFFIIMMLKSLTIISSYQSVW